MMANGWSARRDHDGYLPIEAYGAIGNGETLALVGADGSIDWCPFPRIDSPSVFARILDAERGGFWQIAPEASWRVSRSYMDDTNVLVTRFETDDGVVELVDLMPSIAFGSDFGISQRLRDGMIVRVVRGVEGVVRMRMDLAPRFNYGREQPTWEIIPHKGAVVCGKSGALRVATTIPLESGDNGLVARFSVVAGDQEFVSANYHDTATVVWSDLSKRTAQDLVIREIEGWTRWAQRCSYDGPWAKAVRRSALTLKLLNNVPSGAMAAAATTSLPESLGGGRNWDYRYAWIRDTSYALHAFHSIGYRDEAEGFLQWVIDVTRDDPASLQIMYRVDGESDLDEQILDHLEGYRRSSPVRIGNGAHAQRQLDRFGEVLDAAWVHRRFGGVINDGLWEYLAKLTEVVEARWQEPDAGIWEVRSDERRMTYANVMCWVAIDRAIRLAKKDGRDAPYDEWHALRTRIHADVMSHAVSAGGYFSEAFDDDVLDASALSFPLRGFIDVDHPVMRATIERVIAELSKDELVWRYSSESGETNIDGLAGHEGAFVLCGCWLIDCLVGLSELDRAEQLLEKLLARGNDLGLFSEEIEAATGAFLGNFPQAFSHLGLINAIVNLGRARGNVAQAPDAESGHVTGSIPGGPESRRLQGRPGRS
ncbi:MAG TPA: glycoside hydrolase family 15 protein [Thermomicrobiales bacterium]|jgi:GH15 family glucan-1,4-alpha-glucosidase|nr:glycoside hydrolase family 15 protein [Thermomicrobiales bacterium]